MDEVSKKDFLAKLCCIIAAFCLWTYISIINNPIKTIVVKNISVELINTDAIKTSQLIVEPNQELTVSLTVKCNASKVFDLKANNFKVVADMSFYAIKKGKNRIPVDVEAPSGVTVVKDEGMWVDIEVDSLETKRFSVDSKISGKVQDGTYMNSPIIKPTEAEVSGPATYIAKVEKVIAYGNVDSFTSTSDATLPLMAIDKNGDQVKEVSVTPIDANVKVVMSKIKTVPVRVEIMGSLDSKYVLDSVDNSVETIQITGDQAVLDSITSISTENINISDFTEDKQVNAKLVVPEGIILVNNKSSINVKINIDTIETKTIKCEIKEVNLDENYNSKLETTSVEVTISAGSRKLKNIFSKDIIATVDYTNLNEGVFSIPINISYPSGVNIISKSKDNISVTISKK
ncbi:MAG: YbbR-like domain-containing protein [Clostridiaceae bacterium]